MILINDDLFITVEDTVFRAKKHINPQFQLDPDALQGFYDGVNVKRSETPRPNQWGDFKEPGMMSAREISISGVATANTPQQLHAMRDEFTGLLSHGGYSEITVQNSSGTRYLEVGLRGSPSWVQKIDTAALWKLDLYAPNPRMYGPKHTIQITDSTVSGGLGFPLSYPMNFGGPVKSQAQAIFNNGNTESWPVFVVTGDYFSGFSVSDGNSSFITFTGTVTTSSPVTIDTAAGTAMQNGVDRSILLSRRDWFSIPPNSAIQPAFNPIQDAFGWCDIIYRDTWI